MSNAEELAKKANDFEKTKTNFPEDEYELYPVAFRCPHCNKVGTIKLMVRRDLKLKDYAFETEWREK